MTPHNSIPDPTSCTGSVHQQKTGEKIHNSWKHYTVDGGNLSLFAHHRHVSFLYVQNLFVPGCSKGMRTGVGCLGGVVFTCIHMGLHLHLSLCGCCSTSPVFACSWKGWSKRRSRLSTSHGFCGENSSRDQMVKVCQSRFKTSQQNSVHRIPYCTILNCLLLG